LTRTAHFELSDTLLVQDDAYDYAGNIVDKTVKTTPVKDRAFNVITAIDDADESFTHLPYVKSLRIGNGELKKMELSIGSLFMNSGVFTAYIQHPLRQAQVSQVANVYDIEFSSLPCYNKPGELSKNEFTFRIFSFRGLRPNVSGSPAYLIPYATSDNRNALDQIEPGWIPTMMHEQGFVALLCGMFYRFLLWTEMIEFSAYIPPKEFHGINPIRMGMVEDIEGAKIRFLMDRLSFEPIRGVNQLFSKVKGYIYHKVLGLADLASSTFQINEQSEPEEMVYVGWRFIDRRWQDESDGRAQYAKVQLLFFADPFLMNPKRVTALDVKYALQRIFSHGAVLDDERSITTGTNVLDYISGEETIFSNVGGGQMNVSVIVRNSDNDSYIPI